MAEFIFWLEGVDFNNTVLDTNDISTMRGASLTLLRAPEFAENFLRSKLGRDKVKTISTGASIGGFELTGDESTIRQATEDLMDELQSQGEDPEDIKTAEKRNKSSRFAKIDTAPFAHMRFVSGFNKCKGTENKDKNKSLQKARTLAQGKRYRQGQHRRLLNIDSGVPAVQCSKSRMKAAETTIEVGAEGDGFGSTKIFVSRSVAARRNFGRWARQGFYRDNLVGSGEWFDWDQFTFVDSLHEMVENTRPEPEHGEFVDGLDHLKPPQSVSNKIAVFYADGNKFSTIRDEICDKKGVVEGLRHFSKELLQMQRRHLLTPIVHSLYEKLESRSKPDIDRVAYFDSNFYKLRLETLLWGGDEVKFAMPAWLGWWFARRFFETVESWKIDYTALTFSAGMVFCNYKTPVRSARALARQLAEDGKKALAGNQKNILNVEVLESIDPPQEGIAHLRRRLTGLGKDEGDKLMIPGEEVGDFIDQIARIKGIDSATAATDKQNFPRSQVYRILQLIHSQHKSILEGGKIARDELEKYRQRANAECGVAFDFETYSNLQLTSEHDPVNDLGISLYQLAQHWDYVDEFCCSPSLVGRREK